MPQDPEGTPDHQAPQGPTQPPREDNTQLGKHHVAENSPPLPGTVDPHAAGVAGHPPAVDIPRSSAESEVTHGITSENAPPQASQRAGDSPPEREVPPAPVTSPPRWPGQAESSSHWSGQTEPEPTESTERTEVSGSLPRFGSNSESESSPEAQPKTSPSAGSGPNQSSVPAPPFEAASDSESGESESVIKGGLGGRGPVSGPGSGTGPGSGSGPRQSSFPAPPFESARVPEQSRVTPPSQGRPYASPPDTGAFPSPPFPGRFPSQSDHLPVPTPESPYGNPGGFSSGRISFQEPGVTVAREPTLAETRARYQADLEEQRQLEMQALHEENQQKWRSRLIGGVAIVGIVGVLALAYLASPAERCFDENTQQEVDSRYCTNSSYSHSGGGVYIFHSGGWFGSSPYSNYGRYDSGSNYGRNGGSYGSGSRSSGKSSSGGITRGGINPGGGGSASS